jgi:hypothetical protein
MSTPRRSVNIGTMTTPPPKPVRAPKKPAIKEPRNTIAVNRGMFIVKAAHHRQQAGNYTCF